MAKLRPWDVIPPFFVGKLVSDPIAVFMGKYARGSAVLIRASGVSAE